MSANDPRESSGILLVSNGYGESAITGYIADAIAHQRGDIRIEHFPLVGTGSARAWPPAVGPMKAMPSGGLVANWNLHNLALDLRAGLARLVREQRQFLRCQTGRSAVIAVGDVYCLWLSLAAKKPVVFVATAKSDYVSPHSWIERRIARRAAVVFARDEATAQSLRAGGVNARYAGNLMMDGVQIEHYDLGMDPQAVRIGVLPGSRADAPRAFRSMLERLAAIADVLNRRAKRIQAFVSIAPSVQTVDIVGTVRDAGSDVWESASANAAVVARAHSPGLEIVFVRGEFGDLLDAVQIVLGQAGTANEQAAGAGKPVVAALEPHERPNRMSWYRMRQKRLLGDALLVLPAQPQAFASGVIALLDDPLALAHMADVGRARMGNAGGAAAVATAALSIAGTAP